MQVLTILCALFAATSASAALCPRPCKCFDDSKGMPAANCTDLPARTATAWPQKTLRIRFAATAAPVVLRNNAFSEFPRLTYLDVTGRAVQHAAASAFAGLPELVELNLAGTGLRKLDRRTFAGNRKLAFLSLRNNPGLMVSTSFLASDSVTELDVSACGLSALKSVYFAGLPNLKYLFAAGNRLKELGSQFAPPGIKYVNVADNRIGTVRDDLETYKRLRTVDLTGNPVHCTCELSELDRRLAARGVAFGNTVTCANTGVPLGDMAETCSDKEMLGDDPKAMYKSDDLIEVGDGALMFEETDDVGSGSGSGDGGLVSPALVDDGSEENASNGETTSSSERPQTTSGYETTSEETASREILLEETASEEILPQENTPAETTSEDTTSGETSSEASPAVVQETSEETSTAAALPVDEEVFVKASVLPDLAVNGDGGDDGSSTGSPSTTTTTTSSTAAAAVDHVIMSNPIQLPKDDDDDQEETSLIAAVDYLRSNWVVTGTAVILAVVIMAIVYKAVCLGKSRSRRAAEADGKTVELKEIKYMAADTEDARKRDEDDRDRLATPSSSAEENLLGDRGDTDDSDSDSDDDSEEVESSPSPTAAAAAATNGGLLNNVMNAVDNAPGSPNVPTRVIVKLGETPKASKPITIDNVH